MMMNNSDFQLFQVGHLREQLVADIITATVDWDNLYMSCSEYFWTLGFAACMAKLLAC